MPTITYTPIASVTLSATATQVVFSGLPQTFRDLIVVLDGTVSDFSNILTSLNGDTSNIYTRVQMTGNGSTAGSSAGTHTGLYTVFGAPNERVFAQLQIMDYSQTNKTKTALSRGHTSSSEVAARGLRWPSNNAVTSMSITSSSGVFNVGFTFSIYGVIA